LKKHLNKKMTKTKKQFGLIGYPLSHSFSKKYFSKKFKKENLHDCEYLNYECPDLNKFSEIIKNNPNLIGLNITIPYKEKILEFVDKKDEIVQSLGAANTLLILPDKKIKAYNTDVYGFEKSFSPLLKPHHKKALILGTGGASKAVEFVLKKLQISYLFVSRNPKNKFEIHYNKIDRHILSAHQIIINTTPLGSFPQVKNFPKIPYQFLSQNHYLFDLIYNPQESMFLKFGKEKNVITSNGLTMLHLQAEQSWKIWQKKI